jgi:hypothetical protein
MNNWIKTSRDYEISAPDKDNEIAIDLGGELIMLWLTKEDVLLLLSRFDKENT